MIRYVLLALAVCLLFVIAYFSAGWLLDAEQPQQELKRDVGPQNLDQRFAENFNGFLSREVNSVRANAMAMIENVGAADDVLITIS